MLLVTGGLGYIGSHFVIVALQSGYDVVVIDNLSNSHAHTQQHIETIAQSHFQFIEGDIRNKSLLERIFKQYQIDTVIHFAGLKAVAESVVSPMRYYDNNVYGSLVLLEAMQEHCIQKIVFSSSATVYGEPQYLPYDEKHPTIPINPYGHTKLHVENVLQDVCQADKDFAAVTLRYFNPIGAHPSGLIGENPKDIPNNLMPYIVKVAQGNLPYLQVFGDDYDTRDGTGERDYIYVMDLVQGHLAALSYLNKKGFHIFNLGTGTGTTVLELVAAFEAANSVTINQRVMPRREGDLSKFWANPSLAKTELNWQAVTPLHVSCLLNS
ncbi:UDP-glucose 4-epimerase GalE [Psychrobacter sp. AOP22-C1-C5]|uniref:UDP-glucose 4-epimerase GalE n=1 Tax=Psychrobacter sp. AOP22-C1-C5 TaxID=3457716 RepID=UPI004035223B